MLSSSEEIASRGSIFLYVSDLAAERRRLENAGIVLGSDIPGDYSTLAQVRDPDGNLITLASPPSRDWEMYGFSRQVDVLAIAPGERILVQWRAYGDPTPIEWLFVPRPDNTSFVSITNSGLCDAQQAIDSTEGFAFVLAGAKALLEHGVMLNLVPDRFPDGLPFQ